MSENLPQPPEYTSHAKLSASSAHRWMVCTGSVELCANIKGTTSEYAAEGTYAHHIAACCLEKPDKFKPQDWLDASCEIDGYTIVCDQEMVDTVQTYLGIVRSDMTSADKLLVEQDFTRELKKLHPDLGGISDAIVVQPKAKTLRVYDFKYGSGIPVSAFQNTQMKVYALGALLKVNTAIETVVVCIVQPRYGDDENDPLQTWEFDAVDIIDFAADLVEAAEETGDFDAPLVPGKDQCRFCPAAAQCPALEQHTTALVSQEFDAVGQELPLETLGKALDIIPMVEARIKQLRELAYNEGIKGNPPPGYKIVEKRPRRHWKDAEKAAEFAEMFLGDDAWTEPALKSPAQIEKLLKKGEKKSLEELTEKVSSGYTLVHESDKRQPALLASPDEFENTET